MHVSSLVPGVDGDGQRLESIAMQLSQFFFAPRNRLGPSPVTALECEQNRNSDERRMITHLKTGALDQIGQTRCGHKPRQQGTPLAGVDAQEWLRWLR